jgi:sugar phosphate isomerase/epimerase
MRFIFSTGSLWNYSIERCFRFAAEAGFDGLELMADQRWETRQPDYLRPLMDRYGLPIVAIHSPFSHFVEGWPNDQPGRIRHTVALAEAVGAQTVVHHLPNRIGYIWVQVPGRLFPLPVPWNAEKGYRRWLETTYPEVQASTPITLAIENMPAYRRFGRRWQINHWNTVGEIQRFTHLTLDTTHLGTWGLEPVEVFPYLAGRVAHVHLSNYEGGREHLRPETGRLKLDRLLARMAADDYQGAISLELQPEVLDAGQPDGRVIERMAVSLSHCRQWAAGT